MSDRFYFWAPVLSIWYKGDPGATWVKADIYRHNGHTLALSGVRAENLQDLKRFLHEIRKVNDDA